MRVVMFYHSLVSDWNHGNAHFLRGVASELLERGHQVRMLEPKGGWSRANLTEEYGQAPVETFHRAYPRLRSYEYELDSLDLDRELDGADLVLVHEWNEHSLVERIGSHRLRSGDYRLLFHDTHHRSVTDSASMAAYELEGYDGVLAFGEPVREIYVRRGWANRVWTWHEAADTRVFQPLPDKTKRGDLVWIGNWGDDERTAELYEFLIQPVHALGLKTEVFGVRYPQFARHALSAAGIRYGGWLPNYRVPETFAQFRVTLHIPRRPYVEALPGIPTIRPFEAMACGIPLISAPWNDVEGLFEAGTDYLVARNGAEMRLQLQRVVNDPEMARTVAQSGYRRILARHTCEHRVDELLRICMEIHPVKKRPVTTGIV